MRPKTKIQPEIKYDNIIPIGECTYCGDPAAIGETDPSDPDGNTYLRMWCHPCHYKWRKKSFEKQIR